MEMCDIAGERVCPLNLSELRLVKDDLPDWWYSSLNVVLRRYSPVDRVVCAAFRPVRHGRDGGDPGSFTCPVWRESQKGIGPGLVLLLIYLKERRPASERREQELEVTRLLNREEGSSLLVGVENPPGFDEGESCPSRLLREFMETERTRKKIHSLPS